MVRVPSTTTTPAVRTPNDNILLVGMNEGAKHEAQSLRARGNNVTAVLDSYVGNDKIRGTGSDRRIYDLSSNAGVDNFVATLGLPAAQSAEIGTIIKGTGADARDEMGQLARVWASGEKGGSVPSRLVLSGHSYGPVMWGDNNGQIDFADVQKLAKAMPKAAAQVEDVHLAACYAGTQSNVDGFKDAFPNMKTFFGYHDSAPGSYSGATGHQGRWDTATRGRKESLDRNIVSGTRKGDNVATWTQKAGLNDGQPPIAIDAQRALVNNQEATYQSYLDGSKTQATPSTGPLRSYYNEVQRLIRHPNLTAAEKPALEERRDQAIRMIYYAPNVAPKFNESYKTQLDAGYAAAGLARPNFATMSRADALAAVQAFDAKVAGGPVSPAVAETQRLLHGLRDLNSTVVPATWI